MPAPLLNLTASTFRTLSSCLVVGRPAYRFLTTTAPSQAKAAARSAAKLDASSNDDEVDEAEFKLAKSTLTLGIGLVESVVLICEIGPVHRKASYTA